MHIFLSLFDLVLKHLIDWNQMKELVIEYNILSQESCSEIIVDRELTSHENRPKISIIEFPVYRHSVHIDSY